MKLPSLQRRTLALIAVILPLLVLFVYVALRSGIITVAPPMDNAYWLFDEFLRQFVLWYISELRMPISIELPQHNRTVF